MESMSNNSTRPVTKFDDENLPPGFRFHPMDEELVTYYLTNKVRDSSFSCRAIAEVDLNKCEPWDLPAKAKMGEKEWYFFSLRDRKYPTGLRTNRATEAGYWKATGKDREIYKGKTNNLVGMKKTLVFYKGRAPKGEKTNWVMHEYRLEGKLSYYNLPKSAKDEWVVTRIFQKSCGAKKGPMGLSRVNSFMDVGSPALPPLLESPYIAGSSDGGTTLSTDTDGMDHNHNQFSSQHVTCFSNAMEPPTLKGFTNKYHSQFTSQNNNNPDSASLDYSFLQSMMQDIGNNTPPQNNYYQQSLMSNSLYGIGGANPGYFPFTSLLGQGAFPPTSLFKSFDDQRLKPCKMEPPSTSSSQWTPNANASTATSSHQHRNQPSPQSSKYSSQQNQQPMVSMSQDTGLTTEMNTDISSVVTSQQQQLNQPGNSYQDDALADCYGGGWSF